MNFINKKNRLFSILMILLTVFTGCKDFVNSENEQKDGEICFIKINANVKNIDEDVERTIIPKFELADFTYTLTAIELENSKVTKVFTDLSYEDACKDFPLVSGYYDFELVAKKAEFTFYATEKNYAVGAGENPLNFPLRPEVYDKSVNLAGKFGILKITVIIPKELGVESVEGELLDTSMNTLYDGNWAEYNDETGVYEYSSEYIPCGQYYLKINCYGPKDIYTRGAGTDEINGPLLQYYMEALYISEGKPSETTVTIDSKNPVYNIFYETNGAHIRAQASYTQKNKVQLPSYIRYVEDGAVVEGSYSYISKNGFENFAWYDNPDFTGDPVTCIEEGSTGDKTFYLRTGLYFCESQDKTLADYNYVKWNKGDKVKICCKLEGDEELKWNDFECISDNLIYETSDSYKTAFNEFTAGKPICSLIDSEILCSPEEFSSQIPITSKDLFNKYTKFNLSFEDQKQTANNDSSHVDKYKYILGEAVLGDGTDSTRFNFRKFYSIAKFKLFLTEAQKSRTFTKMIIHSDLGLPANEKISFWEYGNESTSITANYDTDVYRGATIENKDLVLELDNLKADNDGNLILYAAMPPYDLREFHVTLIDSEYRQISYPMPDTDFSKGIDYNFEEDVVQVQFYDDRDNSKLVAVIRSDIEISDPDALVNYVFTVDGSDKQSTETSVNTMEYDYSEYLEAGTASEIVARVEDKYEQYLRTPQIYSKGFKILPGGVSVSYDDDNSYYKANANAYLPTEGLHYFWTFGDEEVEGNDISTYSIDYDSEKTTQVEVVAEGYIGSAIGSDGCIIAGSKIQMQDGSYKNVEDIVLGDYIKSYDFKSGTVVSNKVICIDSSKPFLKNVITLTTSDGKSIGFVDIQDFFDADLKRFVEIRISNYKSMIGKNILVMGDDGCSVKKVQIQNITSESKNVAFYDIIVEKNIRFFADDILTMIPSAIGEILPFDLLEDEYKYDPEKMDSDIAQYGVYTYETFPYSAYVSEEFFDAYHLDLLKIYEGKGIITKENINTVFGYHDLPNVDDLY